MTFNKRGLSQVVATLLLVLVTISAITLIFGYVVPFVRESLSSTSCIKYRDYFVFDDEFSYNCYSSDGTLYALTVKSKGDAAAASNIAGFNLIFSREGKSKVVEVRDDVLGLCSEGVSMLHTCDVSGGTSEAIDIPERGEVSTYVFSNTDGIVYERVKISPVINKDSERVCDPSPDSLELSLCQGVTLP